MATHTKLASCKLAKLLLRQEVSLSNKKPSLQWMARMRHSGISWMKRKIYKKNANICKNYLIRHMRKYGKCTNHLTPKVSRPLKAGRLE